MFRKLAIVLASALLLSGCSSIEPKPWTAGSGPIKVVASTDVWGSIANLVAGKTATVDALIYNVTQDPHSFEPSARDQLAINNADVVIMNGGGYDDFMTKLIAADPTPPIVVNAFDVSGADKTRNEHIWYDVDQVGSVASAIAKALIKADPTSEATVTPSLELFKQRLADRKAWLDKIKAANSCGRVFATEPVIDYLLADAGCQNVTPLEFSRAIEEERDVPPAVMKLAKKELAVPGTKLAINDSVMNSQIQELFSVQPGGYSFGELLPENTDTGVINGDYFYMLNGAIAFLEGF